MKNLAIDDKDIRKLSSDILDARSEQKKVELSRFKKEPRLSKTDIKLKSLPDLSKWQKKRLQAFSHKTIMLKQSV